MIILPPEHAQPMMEDPSLSISVVLTAVVHFVLVLRLILPFLVLCTYISAL